MQHDITLQCKVKDWVMEKVFFPLGERVAFWLSWVLGTPTKTAFPVNEGTLCRKKKGGQDDQETEAVRGRIPD